MKLKVLLPLVVAVSLPQLGLAAVRVELGVEEFAFPDLQAALRKVMLAKNTRGALLSPTAEGFKTRTTGRFAYSLRELTGHSWTYPVGDGSLRVERTADGLDVADTLVFSGDRTTDTLCWRWRAPVGVMRGLKWRADGTVGDWVAKKREFKAIRSVTLELPGGGELAFAFDEPTAVRIGNDGLQSEHASVWFGSLRTRQWRKGERLSCKFRLSGGLDYKVRPEETVAAGAQWIPLDYRKDIVAGSALDFSSFGLSDAPAGKHGWLRNVGGHFEFEGRPGVPVRLYGVNLCFDANCPDEQTADLLVARFRRLGYNSVRVHHHERPLLEGSKDRRAFNPEALDRFDRFMAKLFAAGIYVTTDLYVGRDVHWADLGLPSPTGKQVIGKCVKPFIETTEAGYENWRRFAFDFLGHVNPYTGRAYRDEPGMPLIALINENALYMNWMEFRNYPAAQAAWEKWGGKGLAKDVHEHDPLVGELTRDIETAFFKRATDDLRAFGAKALFTDLSAGGGKPIQEARAAFDYVDQHFYIDHPIFPGARFRQPSYIAGGNPVRNGGLAPVNLKRNSGVAGKPFVSTEWNFTGPGMYRGVGGVMCGALAAVNDWSGAWRFAYSHSLANVPDGTGAINYFDLAGDPLAQTADRAAVALFLRGDLDGTNPRGYRQKCSTGDLFISTDRTCGGFTERGRIQAGGLAFETACPATVWVSALDGEAIRRSRQMMLAHLTDVQSEGTRFGDATRKFLVSWGKGGPCAFDGEAKVELALDLPEECAVYGLETSGARRGRVPATARNGRLSFTCRVRAEDGKARLLYEIVRETDARATMTDDGYLRRKWREDLSDRTTGLDAHELRTVVAKIAAEREDRDPWPVVKAKMFAAICDRVAIDVSGHDWFPTFSPWAYHKDHPVKPVLERRNNRIDREKLSEESKVLLAGNNAGRWTCWKDFCHSVPDWDAIVPLGFPGMKARLHAHWQDKPFYAALDLTADAILRCLDRFIALGEAKVKKLEGNAARELGRVESQVASLRRLRAGAPATAYDVLMFIYLDWVLSENADQFQVRSLGNLDQMLTPYYRADLAAGRTTEAEFRDQLKAFWWQWGSIDNYWGQPVYFGGTRRDGTTEYNEVSRILLDVHDELALPTPKLQLKMARNTPDWVWRKTLDMARRHRSLVFCGEEPMTKVMKSQGHTDEECRTLEIRGCYEFQARGTESRTSIGHINLLKIVADLLEDARVGKLRAATWEEFRAAYERAMTATVDECLKLGLAMESVLGDINCGNMFSLAEKSALEKGEDAFTTGLKYNNTGILQVGIGTTVDALLAVKELVYEKRELTLAELGGIMAADWAGHEPLRLRMLRSKRKWGNNDLEANALGHDLGHLYASRINFRPNSRGGVFQANGHCAKQFVVLGEKTGATPDGRRRGDEMSKNLSATMGADTEGVTALVQTLAALEATDFPGDVPLDVMMLPNAVAGDKGLETMRAVVEAYFANGGCAIHFNIVDAAMLRDAQRHPERYENLQIRVCGWNVRWNDIPRKEQEAYIRRAEEISR